MLLVTSSPGGSLPFCFSRSSSKVLAMRRRASSRLRAVCVSLLTSCRWPQVRFAGGGCPPSKTSPIVTFAKKVRDRDREPVLEEKESFFSSVEQLQRACSLYWQRILVRWDAIDTWKVGFGNFFTRLFGLERPTESDRPTRVREKMSDFRCPKDLRSVLVRLGFWEAELGLLFEATWFWRPRDRRFRSTEKDYEFRGPVRPTACWRTAPPYAHGRSANTRSNITVL